MFHYNLSDSASERAAAILEMIWREAPVLMRAGGGPLGVESLLQGLPVTERERREIVRLRRLRWRMSAIAEAVGRSQPTVSKVCSEAGLARFKVRDVQPRKAEGARIKALRAQRWRWRRIARELGVSVTTAQKWQRAA